MSLREPAMSPATAFWIPAGELGTAVGAVRNGTLLSLQPPRTANAPATAPAAAHRARQRRPDPSCVICSRVMSEAQVDPEEVHPLRRIRRDVVTAADRLIPKGGHLGVEAVIVEDGPEIVSAERESGARQTAEPDPVHEPVGQVVADRHLADFEEAGGLDVGLEAAPEQRQPAGAGGGVRPELRTRVEVEVRQVDGVAATTPVEQAVYPEALVREFVPHREEVARREVAGLYREPTRAGHVGVRDLGQRSTGSEIVGAEPEVAAGDEIGRWQRVDDAVVPEERERVHPGQPIAELERR